MENRNIKRVVSRKKPGDIEIKNSAPVKRKTSNTRYVGKVIKISDDEQIFSVSYSKPHTLFITKDILTNLNEANFIEVNEEVSGSLLKYKRKFTFASKSAIMNEMYVADLYEEYKKKHELLKTTNDTNQRIKNTDKQSEQSILDKKFAKALELIDGGKTIKSVVKTYGLKYEQIKRCIRKRKNNKAPVIEKAGRRTKIRHSYLVFLENHLSNPKNAFCSLYQIKTLMIQKLGLPASAISIYMVHKMIKKINFSYKKCRRMMEARNSETTKQKRYELIETIIKHRMLGRKFIYIDETGFNNFIVPLYGYSRIGTRVSFPVRPKCFNHSVLAAFTDEGILAYQIFEKSVCGQDFGAFIVNLINQTYIKKDGLDKFVFFMDNAKIHIADSWKPLREHIILCLNAPYSPFLNPIEELFGLWKHHFRALKTEGQDQVINNIIAASKKIEEKHTVGFIKHSIKFYFDSLNQLDIN